MSQAYETELRPRSPFHLAASARFQGCGTRTFREGVLRVAFRAGGDPARAVVTQRADGRLLVRVEAADVPAAIDHVRFALGAEDDISPFLERAAADPLLGSVVRRQRGLRPLRLSSVAHASLRAMAGQLISSSEARRIERAVIATTMPRDRDLRLPPSTADLAALTPARLERVGLAGRRAAALVRVCRTLELERLHEHPTPAVVRRIVREPQLGPWTAGVICLEGLGRYEHGLVGDLGLIRLCERQLGRPATADDTAALLARWGEWAGLASTYYLHHPLAGTRGEKARARVAPG